MSRRLIMCGVAALAVAAMVVPSAAADQPGKEPLGDINLTGQFCEDFQVEIVTTANKEVLHAFSSGIGLVTGVLKVEVTNLSTDKTLALNISGPGKFAPDGNSADGTGRWLLFGEAGQLPGPDPGMLLVTGRFHMEFGANGIASMDVQGQVEDVCAMLAS